MNSRDTFADRLEAAAKAKQALLDRARANDRTKDPEFVARQEARAAAARAREERETERRNAKRAEQEAARAKAIAEREAAKAAQAALEAQRAKSSLREQIELLAAQKATRDARYAARKARKK